MENITKGIIIIGIIGILLTSGCYEKDTNEIYKTCENDLLELYIQAEEYGCLTQGEIMVITNQCKEKLIMRD